MTNLGEFAPLRELAVEIQVLFPSATVHFADAFGYSSAKGETLARAKEVLAPCDKDIESIDLVRLPAGATVLGQTWRLLVGDCFAAEQLNHRSQQPPAPELLELPAAAPGELINGDILLIARFGDGTWGHWLGELLPKIAVAEALFPGRFRFAVPDWAIRSPVLGARMVESMAYYGVDETRLLRLRSEQDHRFSSLYALTPVWQKRAIHPDVRTILRNRLARRSEPGRRVALLRGDNDRREIANLEKIIPLLEARFYVRTDIALIPFPDQVDIFSNASVIFSVLGSSLTGLIFAQDATSVVAVSPKGFLDGFFSGLLQQTHGSKFCNVIGPIVTQKALLRDSSFRVPARKLTKALDIAEES